jgi:hypothetical protein
MRSSPDAIVLMTVSEAFLIFVDDILSLYLLVSPYRQLYGYQTVTADLYLPAYPGGYPGIERLKFLCRIIENRLTFWAACGHACGRQRRNSVFAETLHMMKMYFTTLSL